MKKFIIILFILLVLFYLIKDSELINIPDESIRFRVISNSNLDSDILVKEYLTKKILENNKDLFESESLEKSRININKSIKNIDNLISDTFKELNYNKKYNINYGMNYFPSKIYKGVKYDAGYYESLVITIGEGKGDNYFCVLFPPLCMVEEANEYEYKFKVMEILKKFIIKK